MAAGMHTRRSNSIHIISITPPEDAVSQIELDFRWTSPKQDVGAHCGLVLSELP